jgi:hypothetical protein
MKGSCSTGQSPQWAVVPVEEELTKMCGPGSSVGIATKLRTGQSGPHRACNGVTLPFTKENVPYLLCLD